MRAISSILKTTALAAALGAVCLGAQTTAANARVLQRCDEAHCYRVWCHDGVCVRRSYEYGRYMNSTDRAYDDSGYYDAHGNVWHDDPSLPVERYMCDPNGERCHWGRAYSTDY
jgi:hypothetical protein